MAGLMNMFDVQGQGGQMFNAGMQVGRIKSPVAGLGDSIRQVMERARAMRDQQMQVGQTMMQDTMKQNNAVDLYNRTTGQTAKEALARKIAAQQANASLANAGIKMAVVKDPVTGEDRAFNYQELYDEETGVASPGKAWPMQNRSNADAELLARVLGDRLPVGAGGNVAPAPKNSPAPADFNDLMAIIRQKNAEMDAEDAQRRSVLE